MIIFLFVLVINIILAILYPIILLFEIPIIVILIIEFKKSIKELDKKGINSTEGISKKDTYTGNKALDEYLIYKTLKDINKW